MFDINLTFILSFLIFIIAFFVSYRLIYLSISKEAFKYEDAVKSNMQEASQYIREAQKLEDETRKIIESAREKALENYRKKITEATEKANKIIHGAIEHSEKKITEMVSDIEKEKQKMLNKIPEIASALSKDILRKILEREV